MSRVAPFGSIGGGVMLGALCRHLDITIPNSYSILNTDFGVLWSGQDLVYFLQSGQGSILDMSRVPPFGSIGGGIMLSTLYRPPNSSIPMFSRPI